MNGDSVTRYKFRRLIDELEKREGRGTELVTLYIPPNRRVDEVIGYLRQEYSTAANIKSKSTRKNVMDAIESAIQRLKLFNEVPENGLVVFSGAIPQSGPGTEKIEVYHVIPPESINTFLYRCDSKFHVDILKEMLREREAFGVIVLDNEEAAIAVIRGSRIVELETYTSGIPGKHRAGGQSARRFERLREQALTEYYRRVADHANELFLKYPEIKAIILAGPGPTKEVLSKEGMLHYTFKDKIRVIDTSYSGEEGVREAIDKSSELLSELQLVRERRLVDSLMRLVVSGHGVVYGTRQVREALRRNQLSLLIVSEDLDLYEVTIRCTNCDHLEAVTTSSAGLISELPARLASKCPKCGNQTLTKEGERRLLDVLIGEAEETGTKVEIISSTTEAGEVFKSTLQGLAGVMKGVNL
ncbi:MAG: peptide chain release factor aRF-1 [Aigarchaeota archaeon]|nr:peptide chain release factor aRF-1 [Aigarchaeota archaeon]